MNPPRGILLAATGSACGKTTIACGILAALRRRNVPVRSAKCGPDYLDPLWLARAGGGDCPNLDSWMAGPEGVRQLAAGSGLLVVESAMGLYDGIRPDSDHASGAEVARILDLPIVLVVDASGSARTVAAVVRGMRDFGPAKIAGVVANRVGGARHAAMIAEALSSRLLPPLVGFVAQGAVPALPERHLGLVPPESDDTLFEKLADAMEASLDLDAIQALSGPLALPTPPPHRGDSGRGLRLGLSWDEAFRFAYAPAVARLEACGVEVVRFSPLRDAALPEGLDSLWLCGGYPEAHAGRLAANLSMRLSVAAFCATGKPVLAECGGLLYLARDLVDQTGTVFPMCGIIPARGRVTQKLQALGYRTVRSGEDLFVAAAGVELRGHEFHYGVLESEDRAGWRHPWDLESSHGPLGPEGWWNGSVLATWFHGWLAGGDSLDRWISAMRLARQEDK